MAERVDSAGPWPVALAVGFPLAAYLATASAHGYWLDGGELVAQATDFGISHPPGHPLAGVVLSAFAWLIPLGSIAFRVAIASALLTGVAAGALHMAAFRSFRAIGLELREAALLGVAATWITAGSYGWWLQAVRPEVYALQAALVMIAIERIVALEAAWPHGDMRPLYTASLALGLALANHHFLALLLLPAGAATLARIVVARGMRPLTLGIGAVLVGLTTYAYLPLRAGKAYLTLGEPTDVSRFWWVVSAETFQKNQGEGVPQPLMDRFYDVIIQLADSLHLATILLGLAGLYALVRQRGSRRIGIFWGLVLVIFVAARAWLGWVRSNPDALGYLMPAMAALTIAALGLVGTIVRMLGSRRALRLAVVVGAMGLGAGQLWRTLPKASLSDFRTTDVFDEELRRNLPPRAVVLAFGPQTVFRYWGGEAEEALRPDVAFVPIPFLPYPGMPESLVERDESLRDLVAGLRLHGDLQLPDLQSLASQRPVLIELDHHVPQSLDDTLVPTGVYHRVLADGATDADQQEGAVVERARWTRLRRLLGEAPLDLETERQIVWREYHKAIFHAETGNRDEALLAVKHALQFQPGDQVLRGLFEALLTPNEEGERSGPIDTSAFRLVVMGDPP